MTTNTARYIYWEEDGAWLGYLDEFPDYLTQGETRADLEDQLRALYADLTSGELETHMDVQRRHVGELQLA
jgi:predicted RNase H-like HicB family nuclease